jgi:hypothetical protein
MAVADNAARPPAAAGRSDVAAKAALIVSLCALSFAFGAATILLRTFPYGFLRDAAAGIKAYLSLDSERLPAGFQSYAATAAPPAVADGAGEELILISGGPSRRLDLCPRHGCLAWIIDRSGSVLHKWEVDFAEVIADDPVHVGRLNVRNVNPIGMALLPDGSLIATFHGRNLFPYQVGIAKFDAAGTLLWKRLDLSHHWFDVDEQGRIVTPFAQVRNNLGRLPGSRVSLGCQSRTVYEEGVRVLSADGEVLRETSFFDLFSGSDYRGLFYGIRDGCDPLHVNSVEAASPAVAAAAPGVEAGDLLVSVREMSALVLLDGDTHGVKRLIAGRTAAQHSARFLKDGRIAAFDNLGGDRRLGGSRVLAIDLSTGAAETIFPRGGAAEFFSEYQGFIDPSADGRRLLVTSSGQGRVLEIDLASGRALWTYEESEPTDAYRAAHKTRPEGPFARYNVSAAYYVTNADFLAR